MEKSDKLYEAFLRGNKEFLDKISKSKLLDRAVQIMFSSQFETKELALKVRKMIIENMDLPEDTLVMVGTGIGHEESDDFDCVVCVEAVPDANLITQIEVGMSRIAIPNGGGDVRWEFLASSSNGGARPIDPGPTPQAKLRNMKAIGSEPKKGDDVYESVRRENRDILEKISGAKGFSRVEEIRFMSHFETKEVALQVRNLILENLDLPENAVVVVENIVGPDGRDNVDCVISVEAVPDASLITQIEVGFSRIAIPNGGGDVSWEFLKD
jgi:hypothetical protein